MNAIYARQSVDRADSISIESQIEFCAYELKGAPYQVFADRGFSGKNTDRPAFTQMMRDIARGKIRKVVVYKLDRISRSILDFSSMMEQFEKYRVEFISTIEKFDTSSPIGRAMLSICIVFAQLERETIQKRVADAYFSRSQKSFYMGGRVPYGFRLIPTTLGEIHTSMYEAIPEEAEQIGLIYQLYSNPSVSYRDVIQHLSVHGIKKRGMPWSRTQMAALLKNPIYVRADRSIYQFYSGLGVSIVNSPEDFIGSNGCYFYHSRIPSSASDPAPESGHLVLAPHMGIVSSELWLACRTKNLEAARIRPRQKARNTWLAGKIKCGHCGYALIEKHFATSGHRYFICSNRMNTKTCPGPGTLYADELEHLIGQEIFSRCSLFHAFRSHRAKQLNSNSFLDAWEKLPFDQKRRVADLIIRVIHITNDTVSIEWRI